MMIKKKKEGSSVIENMLVALLGIVMTTAFLVIVFGAFASISDKWNMNQVAREYLLLMETEGYLTATDKTNLIQELEECGLYNISLTGTTTSEVDYGTRIYLKISGKYDNNVLRFAGGISEVTKSPTSVTIHRQSTAKQ